MYHPRSQTGRRVLRVVDVLRWTVSQFWMSGPVVPLDHVDRIRVIALVLRRCSAEPVVFGRFSPSDGCVSVGLADHTS